MKLVKQVLWYGVPPQPGEEYRFERRGFTIHQNKADDGINDALLSQTLLAIVNYRRRSSDELGDGVEREQIARARHAYAHIPAFVQHNVRVIVLGLSAEQESQVREAHFRKLEDSYPWDEIVYFRPDLKEINFDLVVDCPAGDRWSDVNITLADGAEGLGEEEARLVARAFKSAEKVKLTQIYGGQSGSLVFIADEFRRGAASFGYWTFPRIVKVGRRDKMQVEIRAMEAVVPYIPFELRPNLQTFVMGLHKAVYVADFVEKSESLLGAAISNRGENATSNLFNRTLHRLRDRSEGQPEWQTGSPLEAAETLRIMSPDGILPIYLDSERIRRRKVDIHELWKKLRRHEFKYRAGLIHGDLHGENVRVRGDDAIVIDFGAVKPQTGDKMMAPLCIDAALLDVSLAFDNKNGIGNDTPRFDQPQWEGQITPLYRLESILRRPDPVPAALSNSWLLHCLKRIRSFAIYEQSNDFEYAIALVIALLKLCKYPSNSDADKGRRVVALDLGITLIEQILERTVESNPDSRQGQSLTPA